MNSRSEDWQSLSLVIPEAAVDDLSTYCFECGSCGLEVGDADDAGSLKVVAYFKPETDVERIAKRIADLVSKQGYPFSQFEHRFVASRDWSREWRKYFTPIQVSSRIVLHPPWIDVDAEIPVAILPKMAFGTGGHESTRLCLLALEAKVSPGCSCLDIGTGSGVLAIAALQLGASRVLAIDTDQAAIDNATENFVLNLCEKPKPAVRRCTVGEVKERDFDLVLANIQSSALVPILPQVRDKLAKNGVGVFSGLLAHEERSFVARLEETGFVIEQVEKENEWICVTTGRGC